MPEPETTDPKRDPLFRVEVIRQMECPQQAAWFAMHQDYAESFVADDEPPDEAKAGEIIISHLLAGNRGHFGPLEHPQIILNAGWFPHSCMQQIRTHRIGISMDVQSGRYTGNRVVDAANGLLPIEQVFYFRPEGQYRDRSGKFYTYTEADIAADHATALAAAKVYADRLDRGWAEEHARDMLPFGIRQHWVLSANARSLMHLMDLRAKADAQLECQQLCDLIWPHFAAWMPQVAKWYREKRWGKALLAP